MSLFRVFLENFYRELLSKVSRSKITNAKKQSSLNNIFPVYRPATRTTKTISDASDSSRSSIHLERPGLLREGGTVDRVESYTSFQSELRAGAGCSRLYSPDSTLNSERLPGLAADCEAGERGRDSRPGSGADRGGSDTASMLHETHFGDSLSDIPTTVVRPGTALSQQSTGSAVQARPGSVRSPSRRFSLFKIGNTIFDCELGCFISVKEFERKQRRSRESLKSRDSQ